MNLIRKPGSVFLTPEPVTIPNVTHIGDRFKDWVNVANEMVAEVEPEPMPVAIESTTPIDTPQKPIGDRMTDLIAEVDSITSADPKTEADAVRRPAADRRVEKAVEHLNKRDAERKGYEKFHGVEAKREVALALLAELEVS